MSAVQSETEKRFGFGRNWARFLAVLDEERIAEAVRSLRAMLGVQDLKGRSFLDIGSGSGLFSLAARRLGAGPIHSFDYDPQSVACTEEMRRRYFTDDEGWTIEQGSVLDGDYVRGLGRHDVVYSWGVLHHTGQLWKAMAHAVEAVRPGGTLFIAIYNDQGMASRVWTRIKRTYVHVPILRLPLVLGIGLFFEVRSATAMLFRGQNPLPFARWRNYKKSRGMSVWHDLVDWVGGYPFEVAKPEEVFDFCAARGFVLRRLKTCAGGLGCNEYVFHLPDGVPATRTA